MLPDLANEALEFFLDHVIALTDMGVQSLSVKYRDAGRGGSG
jgi:hypothetical protein